MAGVARVPDGATSQLLQALLAEKLGKWANFMKMFKAWAGHKSKEASEE